MKKLKWGLIGLGDIARKRVAPALSSMADCELIAVNRARVELAPEFATEFGARRWYRDWREVIADSEVEAVYLATPVYLHAEQTIAAAEAGKHVLCEKPMAMSIDECDRMIAACRANGVKLSIAYYRHFYPVIDRIKELLAGGELGRAVIARINAFERFNPQPGEDRYWLLEKAKSGGGPMMDFGCHRIEVLLNLLGPIEKTVALTGRVLFEREVEDTAVAAFRFASGAQAVLSVTHAASESQDSVEIFCSEGTLVVPALNRGELLIRTSAGESRESHPPHENIHLPLIEDFTRSVIDGREPVVDGPAGREVSRILEEIYK